MLLSGDAPAAVAMSHLCREHGNAGKRLDCQKTVLLSQKLLDNIVLCNLHIVLQHSDLGLCWSAVHNAREVHVLLLTCAATGFVCDLSQHTSGCTKPGPPIVFHLESWRGSLLLESCYRLLNRRKQMGTWACDLVSMSGKEVERKKTKN